MGWVMAPARQLRGHQFGNVVLSRLPIAQHLEHDLSWKTCEPRRLQRVDIAADGCTLHVYNVHLGTAMLERRHQAERLATIVTDRHVAGPEAGARRFQRVDARAGDDAAQREAEQRRPAELPAASGAAPIRDSFRSCTSITSTTPASVEIVGIELPRTRLSLVASDHLPLVADVRLG